MAPPDTIWHKESLKLKEIFGTKEGFEICPYQLFPGPIKAPFGMELCFHGTQIPVTPVGAPGIFFLPFPTRACFCPHLTKQFGLPSHCV